MEVFTNELDAMLVKIPMVFQHPTGPGFLEAALRCSLTPGRRKTWDTTRRVFSCCPTELPFQESQAREGLPRPLAVKPPKALRCPENPGDTVPS